MDNKVIIRGDATMCLTVHLYIKANGRVVGATFGSAPSIICVCVCSCSCTSSQFVYIVFILKYADIVSTYGRTYIIRNSVA
jgi:hypothetical protein